MRGKGGPGIGLAVSRSLAELHGGVLEAASAGPGRGCELTLRLPCGAAPAGACARDPSQASLPSGRRVLVIDDGADLRESMSILLELLGHAVLTAPDGRSGIELARRERPDLALVDLGLPDLDGCEVARALRADPATRGLRLIALSGYAMPEHQERALAAGFELALRVLAQLP